jgi:hypothetical protein
MGVTIVQKNESGGAWAGVGSVLGGALIWCTVGIGVATLISALVIFVWAIYVFAVAWRAAALLGSIQGLWLFAERARWKNSREQVRFGLVSGAALGLLGFVPSYVQIEMLPPHRWWGVGVFAAAAFFGGMAAGGVTAVAIGSRPEPQGSTRAARRLVVGVLLMLGGAALEYSLYWPSLIRKLPILRLDESSVVNLPPGNARGSQWSGCFQYLGETFWASGGVGKEGGMLTVRQDGGALQITMAGSSSSLAGGVDADGRFWTGAQRPVPPDGLLRTLLRGRFQGTDRFEYSLRLSYLKGLTFVNTTRVDGTASRCK